MFSFKSTSSVLALLLIFQIHGSLVEGKYDNKTCGMIDSRCNLILDRIKDRNRFEHRTYPLALTPEMESLVEPNDNLMYDNSTIFICIGRNNRFSYVREKNDENKGLISYTNRANITCVCGSIFKFACKAYDTDFIWCQKPHEADITLLDRELELSFWQPYKNRTIESPLLYEKYEVSVSIDGPFFANISIIYSRSLCRTCYVHSRIKKLDSRRLNNPDTLMEDLNIRMDHSCSSTSFKTIYNQQSQKRSFDQQLSSSQNYLKPNTKYVIVPVYLTPANTLPHPSGFLVTNISMNTAPQWKSIRDGNWNITERYINYHLASKYNFEVITGAFGHLSLNNVQTNESSKLYLYYEKKETEIPLYFVKIAYRTEGIGSQKLRYVGTAYITINNPYVTSNDKRNYTSEVCTKCIESKTMPHWNYDTIYNSDTKTYAYPAGYSFYCDIRDFLRNSKFMMAKEHTHLFHGLD